MRLSHKHKYIFFSNPKTGSTTLRELLGPHSDELHLVGKLKRTKQRPFYTHISPLEVKVVFQKNGWDFQSYSKFTFIRNPWARLVSLYEHTLRKSETQLNFRDWVLQVKPDGEGGSEGKTWQAWRVYGTYSIEHFIKDKEGNILVDKVFRLEDINEQLVPYLHGLGLKKIRQKDIKHQNRRKNGKAYTEYYNKETKAYVASIYRYDIINYGYTFEGIVK